MENKIHDVICRGRVSESGEACQTVIYRSDGEFMYILEFVLNADLDKQTVKCSNCGYTMIWRRREEFITKNDGGRQNLNKRRERQKYQSSFSK